MTEGRATGIPKILHAMQANGSPPPVFDFDEDHTYFMCRLPIHPQANMPEGLIEPLTAAVESGAQSGVQSGVQSQMAMAVLRELEGDAAGKSSIAKSLGKTGRTRYLSDLMKKLLNDELVEYTIPDKPNSRLQKYRLTQKGRKVILDL
jgi:ATP-dependent DNA helicase RecG